MGAIIIKVGYDLIMGNTLYSLWHGNHFLTGTFLMLVGIYFLFLSLHQVLFKSNLSNNDAEE